MNTFFILKNKNKIIFISFVFLLSFYLFFSILRSQNQIKIRASSSDKDMVLLLNSTYQASLKKGDSFAVTLKVKPQRNIQTVMYGIRMDYPRDLIEVAKIEYLIGQPVKSLGDESMGTINSNNINLYSYISSPGGHYFFTNIEEDLVRITFTKRDSGESMSSVEPQISVTNGVFVEKKDNLVLEKKEFTFIDAVLILAGEQSIPNQAVQLDPNRSGDQRLANFINRIISSANSSLKIPAPKQKRMVIALGMMGTEGYQNNSAIGGIEKHTDGNLLIGISVSPKNLILIDIIIPFTRDNASTVPVRPARKIKQVVSMNGVDRWNEEMSAIAGQRTAPMIVSIDGLISILDALFPEGITINNPVTFQNYGKDYIFKEGIINLKGKELFLYLAERKAFGENGTKAYISGGKKYVGDAARAKKATDVAEQIIKQLLQSKNILRLITKVPTIIGILNSPNMNISPVISNSFLSLQSLMEGFGVIRDIQKQGVSAAYNSLNVRSFTPDFFEQNGVFFSYEELGQYREKDGFQEYTIGLKDREGLLFDGPFIYFEPLRRVVESSIFY